MNQKNKQYTVKEALEKLEYWKDTLGYFTYGSDKYIDFRDDFKYIEETINHLNSDKKTDHLRFVKMFKKLFAKQNKELTEENLELKKELAVIKREKDGE